MSDTNSSVTSNASVETFTPDIHARVRASVGRCDRIRAFLYGHLPAGVTVEVVLTPAARRRRFCLPTSTPSTIGSPSSRVF
jgi:hypothetical protein